MSPRVRGWVLGGSAALVIGVLALHIVWPQPGDENYWPWALGLMAFPVAAALILTKRPGNGVGRAMGVVALSSLANFGAWWYVGSVPNAPLVPWADLLSELAVFFQFGGMIFLLFVFPQGRTYSRLHSWVARAFVALGGVGMLMWVLSPGPLPTTKQPNPVAVLPHEARNVAEDVWEGNLAVFSVLGVLFLVLRWRQADSVERLQLRWFVLAAMIAIGTLFALPGEDDGSGNTVIDVVAGVVIAAAIFWSLPAAIAVAVTRYRLYEIDRLFSRTVSYALVVALLASVYAAITVGLPQILPDTLNSSLRVAAATLAAAALFNPVRRRVQRLVDRRFNRVRYDVKQQMDRLASRLRTELDLGEINAEILGAVTTTMQPTTASVWIRGIKE